MALAIGDINMDKNYYLNEWRKQHDPKRKELEEWILRNTLKLLIQENSILRADLNRALHALAKIKPHDITEH